MIVARTPFPLAGITGHLSEDSALCTTVKELLDNALDACRLAPESTKSGSSSKRGPKGRSVAAAAAPSDVLIKICISPSQQGGDADTNSDRDEPSHLLLTVSDSGCGISSIPDSLVLFSSSTKASPQSVATGRFGLGLTSTLLHAWGKTGVPCRVASQGTCYEVSFDLNRDEVVLEKVPAAASLDSSGSGSCTVGTTVTVPVPWAYYKAGIEPTLSYLSLLCHVPESLLPAVSFTSPGASALLPTGRPGERESNSESQYPKGYTPGRCRCN